jgi:hypothetical protein
MKQNQNQKPNEFISADLSVDITNPAPANGTDFQLRELQTMVGGFVEVLPLNDGRLMILNEDGKSLRLPINARATMLAAIELSGLDSISGNVVVIQAKQLK